MQIPKSPTIMRWIHYEVDLLLCPRCGGCMRVIAVIDQPAVIRRASVSSTRLFLTWFPPDGPVSADPALSAETCAVIGFPTSYRVYRPSTTSIPESTKSNWVRGSFPVRSVGRVRSRATICETLAMESFGRPV